MVAAPPCVTGPWEVWVSRRSRIATTRELSCAITSGERPRRPRRSCTPQGGGFRLLLWVLAMENARLRPRSCSSKLGCVGVCICPHPWHRNMPVELAHPAKHACSYENAGFASAMLRGPLVFHTWTEFELRGLLRGPLVFHTWTPWTVGFEKKN